MKKIVMMSVLMLSHLTAFSAVTISFSAELLKTAGGAPMPTDGLVLFVATGPNLTFDGPSTTSFISGDDHLIASRPLDSLWGPGVLQGSFQASLGGTWAANQPFGLYWYPTLTIASLPTGPGVSTSYGFGNEANWITPSDGGTASGLTFFTSDATILSAGGPHAAAEGLASNLTPVPEPSTYAAAFGMLCLAGALMKRKFIR